MEDSGFWEVGTITENKKWDIKNASMLAVTNEGTSSFSVHGFPIEPGGKFTITLSTSLKNDPVLVKFSPGGKNLLRYSLIRKNPCNNE